MDGWMSCMNDEIIIRTNNTEETSTISVIQMGTVVMCNLRGFLLKGQASAELSLSALERASDQPFETLAEQSMQIGENDTIPGLELSLKYMPLNRPCRMRTTAKFAYAFDGRPEVKGVSLAIPPDTALEYEVLVTRIVNGEEPPVDADADADDSTRSVDGKEVGCELSLAAFHRRCREASADLTLRKDCGNRWFSYGDWQKAARSYSKGMQKADAFFGSLEGFADVDVASLDAYRHMVQLRLALLTNLASSRLGAKEYLKAKDACIAVLEVDPGNRKALLRAARAALGLHEHDEARLCLQRLLEQEPANVAALQEMHRLKEAVRASLASETVFAKNIIKSAPKSLPAPATAQHPSVPTTATAATIGGDEKLEKKKNMQFIYITGLISAIALLVLAMVVSLLR